MTVLILPTALPLDPRVARVARALSLSMPTTLGHLTMALCHAADHCPDGDLSGVTDELVQQWAQYTATDWTQPYLFADRFWTEFTDDARMVTVKAGIVPPKAKPVKKTRKYPHIDGQEWTAVVAAWTKAFPQQHPGMAVKALPMLWDSAGILVVDVDSCCEAIGLAGDWNEGRLYKPELFVKDVTFWYGEHRKWEDEGYGHKYVTARDDYRRQRGIQS
jgi:hypothetical protein